LRAGSYTPAQLAAEIQSEINGAADISAAASSVAVTLSGGQLLLTSDRYGSASNANIIAGTATVFTGTTASTPGVDVVGSVGGILGTGSGQVLTGVGDAAGLKLTIEGSVTGSRGTVKFSQGYAYQLNTLTTSMLDTEGLFAGKTDGLNDSIKDIGKQRDVLNRRLAAVEASYRKQFNALDSIVASMQTTATYLTQQLAQISALNKQINS
jgi:flagellar hook-associated protein 2